MIDRKTTHTGDKPYKCSTSKRVTARPRNPCHLLRQDIEMGTKKLSGFYAELEAIENDGMTPRFIRTRRNPRADQADRQALRLPKNIGLVEPDPTENGNRSPVDVNFDHLPNENMLLAQIREINGADCSDDAIIDLWRSYCPTSVSPEPSADPTSSSPDVHPSASSSSEFPDSSNSVVEYSELTSDNSEILQENSLDSVLTNCRYAKNALIIGLCKNNIIKLDDLGLQSQGNEGAAAASNYDKPEFRSDQVQEFELDQQYARVLNEFDDLDFEEQRDMERCEKVNNWRTDLVEHPDDPDFRTTSLQAHGKVGDQNIDYMLNRKGKKTVVTPRQFFINSSLDDSIFKFKRDKPKASKPALQSNRTKSPSEFVQTSQPPKPVSTNFFHSPFETTDNSFVLNKADFPALR